MKIDGNIGTILTVVGFIVLVYGAWTYGNNILQRVTGGADLKKNKL